MELNPRQERFVQEYLIDLNARQAAIRAGYSPKSNHSEQLLSVPQIAAAVARAQEARAVRTGITQDWVIKRLKREIELDGEGASASARVAAIGLAMKHLGMFTEDAPHPARVLVDLNPLSDDALDTLLAAVGPLLPAELRALGAPGEGAPAPPVPVE